MIQKEIDRTHDLVLLAPHQEKHFPQPNVNVTIQGDRVECWGLRIYRSRAVVEDHVVGPISSSAQDYYYYSFTPSSNSMGSYSESSYY